MRFHVIATLLFLSECKHLTGAISCQTGKSGEHFATAIWTDLSKPTLSAEILVFVEGRVLSSSRSVLQIPGIV